MENLLLGFSIIIGIIVLVSVFNEKKLHIPSDIAILICSSIIGIIFLIFNKSGIFMEQVNFMPNIRLDDFLLECTLCFMLFAGASKVRLNKFVKNIVPISLLAMLTTIASSVIYGGLFYLICNLLHIDINIWVCILLGVIVSPTDPIAATGILGKLGLSKSMISVIEGESLLNDGMGVALLIFVKGIVTNGVGENFFILIFKEIVGAVVVGYLISFLLFKLLKLTNEPVIHILISLLTVSLSYVICEHCGFSGVIASVVCGMYYSYELNKIKRWQEVVDPKELYEDFWNIVETLLNSVLFVLVGISIGSMEFNLDTLLFIPIAIILNLVTRFLGVAISAKLLKKNKIPSKYSFKEFVMLLTWTGLKGGISLALVLSVQDILPENIYVILLNITIVTILFTTIVQGLTTNKFYRHIESIREKRIEEIS